MKGLTGKVAIVTGGGAGIGKATCEAFINHGAKVVIAEINTIAGQQLESSLRQQGGEALFVETNIAIEDSICRMVALTLQEFGRIDILVNNAAVFVMRGIAATVEEWEKSLQTNVIGSALCAKHCVPEMKKIGKGSIVNLCSISSFIAQPEFLTYSATKGALATMTKCMALELAPFNIRVNSVCPGTVWTDSTAEFFKETLGLSRPEADCHPEIGGAHMLERNADPEEIAEAILFLTSDSASFITAENLMVDGGYTAR
jgi:NAD(P)-dependent dehydrogenase (short-subunit alcohol dehydrogenase family)